MTGLARSAQVGAVVLLAVFWAVNWPLMKIALAVVEPWTFRAFMVLVGGAGCLGVAAMLGQSVRVPRPEWRPLLLLGLVQGVLWNAFSGFGIAMVEAGRASVLAFTMPVWATLLSVIVLREPLTGWRVAGLVLGMAGIALLVMPAAEAMGGALTGTALMLAGAFTWAVSTVLVKATRWTISPLTLAGWHLLIGAGPLWCAAIVLGAPATLLQVDLVSGSAVAFSTLVPMIFCQAVFLTLVRRLPASIASMGTLLVPPLGVFFSALILGERVGLAEAAALVLVVMAIMCVLPGFNWRASLRPQPASPPG